MTRHARRLYAISLTLIALVCLFGVAAPAQAHANLSTADPAPNTGLLDAPAEIRLTFTEPLEAAFSQITLRDAAGERVSVPAAVVDAANPTQLVLQPGPLADGIYTVVWRVVSAADGHSTAGSYPFAVGTTAFEAAALVGLDESVGAESVAVRWLNFLGMALLAGAAGFWLFVWHTAALPPLPQIERRLEDYLWFAWVLAGCAAILSLLLQVAIAADTTLLGAINSPVMSAVLRQTRFGVLWQIRLALWGAAGITLLALENQVKMGRSPRLLLWGTLGASAGVLLTTSLHSHASAAADANAAILGDWLHLLTMALWVGGLAVFALVIHPVSKAVPEATASQTIGRLVGTFSNLMRVAVAGLILTGFYSAWLQVGTPAALFTTLYGRALLFKLILTLPLLALAGINLILTQRGLARGEAVWVGRLRALVGAELALLCAVLLAVGVMTAGTPARGVIAVREAKAPPAPDTTYFEMQTDGDLMAHLQIAPGTVGDNTFTVSLYDADNAPVADASLIRLRFESETSDMGESELRPEPQGDGTYVIDGANLSIPGSWQVRMTVRRPGAFDTVLDFAPAVEQPSPPPAPVVETELPPFDRLAAALLAGISLVGVGGFFAAAHGARWTGGADWLAAALIAAGAAFLVTAAGAVGTLDLRPNTVTVREAWMPPAAEADTGTVYLTLNNPSDVEATLIRVETTAALSAGIALSQTRDGQTLVRPVDDLGIAPASTLTLAPGGYHLTLDHLTRDFAPGDSFEMTLVFGSGQTTAVIINVQDPES